MGDYLNSRYLTVVVALFLLLPAVVQAEESESWREPILFRRETVKDEGLECLVRLKDGTAAFGTLRYVGDGVYQLTASNGDFSFRKDEIANLVSGQEARALKEALTCMKNMLRLQAESRSYNRRHGYAKLKEMKQYFPIVFYADGITPALIQCPSKGYYEIVDWFDFSVRCTDHDGVQSCRKKLNSLGYDDEENRELLELLGILLTIGIYR